MRCNHLLHGVALLAIALAGCDVGLVGSHGAPGDADGDGEPDGPGGEPGGGGGDGGGEGEGWEPGVVAALEGTASTAACHGSPAGEDVTRLVDGDPATKFLGRGTSVWARVDVGVPAVLASYALTSANDAPERDPASWVLEGSNDGVAWAPVDVRMGEGFATRFERRELEVATDRFYRHYQLRMESVTGDMVQVGELELFGTRPGGAAAALPSAPADVAIAALSRSAVRITWRDTSGDEALFRVEQSDGGEFETVTYAPAGATSIELGGLPPGATRQFRVVAENAAGQSAPSAAADGSTQPALVATTNGDGSKRYSEGGYTLTVENRDAGTPQATIAAIVEEYFATYPAMRGAYNTGALSSLRVVFDPDYDGVAGATANDGRITISSSYAKAAPTDIGVVVHEGFHVVERIDNPDAPGWAIEGLADYARARYGTHNAGSCWTMQHYQPGQSYTDAYGVTATFLTWIEAEVHPGITGELDAAMRDQQYSASFWSARTGKTVDQLWQSYAADTTRAPATYR